MTRASITPDAICHTVRKSLEQWLVMLVELAWPRAPDSPTCLFLNLVEHLASIEESLLSLRPAAKNLVHRPQLGGWQPNLRSTSALHTR
jgi:hypothetical protein